MEENKNKQTAEEVISKLKECLNSLYTIEDDNEYLIDKAKSRITQSIAYVHIYSKRNIK